MHSFIEQLTDLPESQPWQAPTYPNTDNPEWLVAVNTASSDKQRTDIANAWLWRLNSEMIVPGPGSPTVVMHVLPMYEHAYRYATRTMFTGAPYDGSLDFIGQSFNFNNSQGCEPLVEKIEALWFAKENAKSAAIALVTEMSQDRGHHKGTRLYPLLNRIVHYKLTPTDMQCEELEYAIIRANMLIGRYCVEKNLPTNLLNCDAWQLFAHYGYASGLPYDLDGRVAIAKKIVAAADPLFVAPYIVDMIDSLVDNDSDCNYFIPEDCLLNPGHKREYDLYQPFHDWVPQLSAYWTTCADLGIPHKEAVEKAFALNMQQAASAPPDTITY